MRQPVAVLAFLASEKAFICPASDASAEKRYGASRWVAPAISWEAPSATDSPRVVPHDRERGWETALRRPLRVAFLPLNLMGNGLESGAGYFGARYLEAKPWSAPQ